jgi:NAD(P)H dehydrogenase (quinone)
MPVYAVTGTSSHLGRFAIKQMLARGVPPSHVVAVERTRGQGPLSMVRFSWPRTATSLAGRGVQVREGDYLRPETLGAALADVSRLLLVPAASSQPFCISIHADLAAGMRASAADGSSMPGHGIGRWCAALG